MKLKWSEFCAKLNNRNEKIDTLGWKKETHSSVNFPSHKFIAGNMPGLLRIGFIGSSDIIYLVTQIKKKEEDTVNSTVNKHVFV